MRLHPAEATDDAVYGFRKVQKLNSGALKTAFRNDELEFRHECASRRLGLTDGADFQRDHPELMTKITRKKAGEDAGHGSHGANDAQVQNLLSRLGAVTERQDALAREFSALAGANKALWDEQQAVQAKYDHQQQAIQSIINFLAIQYNGQIVVDTGSNGRELPSNNALERMTAIAKLAQTAPAAGSSRPRPDSTARRRLEGPAESSESRLQEVSDRSAVSPPLMGRRAIEAKPESSRSASPLVHDSDARFSLLPDSPPTVNEHAFPRSGSVGAGPLDALAGLDPHLSEAVSAYNSAGEGAFAEFDATRPLDPNAGALVPYDSARGLEHVRADMAAAELSIEQIMAEIDALGGGSGGLGQSGDGRWEDFSDFLKADPAAATASEAPVAGPSRKRKSSAASETAAPVKRGRA